MADTIPIRGVRRERLGLRALALFLGTISWFMIQDAIRVDSAARKGAGMAAAAGEAPAPPLEAARVRGIPIQLLAPPGAGAWEVEPAEAAVFLEGRAADLERFEKGEVRLFVDGTVLPGPGTYTLTVKAYVPAGWGVRAQADPPRARVVWRAQESNP